MISTNDHCWPHGQILSTTGTNKQTDLITTNDHAWLMETKSGPYKQARDLISTPSSVGTGSTALSSTKGDAWKSHLLWPWCTAAPVGHLLLINDKGVGLTCASSHAPRVRKQGVLRSYTVTLWTTLNLAFSDKHTPMERAKRQSQCGGCSWCGTFFKIY